MINKLKAIKKKTLKILMKDNSEKEHLNTDAVKYKI